MPYIKLLTALTALALLTACGGATPTATGDPSQTTDCAANPFGASCIAEDINVEARITDCIKAGNAGDTKCASLTSDTAMNTAINTCLTNPFTDACTSDGAFATYADTARVNRVSFCGMTGNAGNALCTALTTCQTNLFDPTCGAYFEPARISHCETNDVVVCPNVTTADLLASFTAGTAPPATPDTTTRKDEFLAATATGFNTGANADIRATFGNPTTDIAIQTLTFAEANTATGGVAFFGGELYTAGTSTGTDFYYAGVLAGTDLGAPITENITSAKWTGQIRANANIDGAEILALAGADFELDITFDGAKGTITTIFARGPQFVYEIDGMFDENGIITGSVDYGAGDVTNGINMASSVSSFYSPGTLTGIIGQNGAVGAFHSNNNTGVDQASFSGGFVAAPPALDGQVDTADWLAGFDGTLNTAGDYTREVRHEFLQGTENGLDFGNVRDLNLPNVRTFTLEPFEGEAKNGVAWFVGGDGATGIIGPVRLYAGILSGTDLGAPLTSADASVSVAWAGKFRFDFISNTGSISRGGSPSRDFDLTVDFANSEIRAFVKRQLNPADTDHFLLKATFDNTGRFDGTINHATFAGSVEAGAQTKVTTGVLTGIIGKQGAVGAFISNEADIATTDNAFVGGFVAAPPPPSVATHATFKAYYADSARTPDRTLLATPTATTAAGAFVEGTATGLPTEGLTFTVNGTFEPIAVRLKEAENGDDGFAVMYGISGSSPRLRAGLLSGTDLGPAVATTSTATWAGSLHWANALSGLLRFALPTVTVDFANGTIKTDPVTVRSDRTIAIDGLFRGGIDNGLPVGILGGNAVYTDEGSPANIPLIGLIGTEGAIGVFASFSTNVVGGFQASPSE